jgi:hypothetical protein
MQTSAGPDKTKISKKNRTILKAILLILIALSLIIWGLIVFLTPGEVPVPVKEVTPPAVSKPIIDSNKVEVPVAKPVVVPPKVKKSEPKPRIVSTPTLKFPEMGNGYLSGCGNITDRYDKNLKTKLIITCGDNADVAVKMIDKQTNKTIRYTYIKKSTTYTILHIPEGTYFLKIAYGSNWGVFDSEPLCAGRFTKNAVFEKGEELLDYKITYNSAGKSQIPSYALKLNVTYGSDKKMDDFDTNNIPESEFYNY